MKCLVLFAIALGLSLPPSWAQEGGQQWRFLVQDTPYAIRLHMPVAAEQASPGVNRVWTKTVPTEKGNPEVSEIRSLWELDCRERKFRNVRTVVVIRQGGSEETEQSREWTKLEPGIWVEKLFEVSCPAKH